MSAFSGSLQHKKKSELQEIAVALRISDAGTREEMRDRIKAYLQQHENSLSDDARFGGLYGRSRKRSVQPQMTAIKEDAASVDSSEEPEERVSSRPANRRGGRHTATHAPAGQNDSLVKVMQELEPANVPLPASPLPSAVKQAASVIRQDASAIVQRMKEQERTMVKEGRRLLKKTQLFLSDASNIYTMTLLFELFLLLNAITPTSTYYFPGNRPPSEASSQYGLFPIALRYPHPSFFITSGLWLTLLRWSLPTLIVPQFFGALISFTPTISPSSSTVPSSRDIDVMTIGIMRVACSVASDWGLADHDLSRKWRIISACVGAAFAFAEAIGARKKEVLTALGARRTHEA